MQYLRHNAEKLESLKAAAESNIFNVGIKSFKVEEFSSFDDKSGYNGMPPKYQFLEEIFCREIDSHENIITKQMQKWTGLVLKGDMSFKVIKRMAKQNGIPIFSGLYSVMNEFNQVRSIS